MKARNLFLSFFTVLLMSYAALGFADDVAGDALAEPEIMTVNVNSADAETIASTLVGVGFTRAQAIVAYRDQYGPFYSAEELTAVKGIGKSTVEKNVDRIRVE